MNKYTLMMIICVCCGADYKPQNRPDISQNRIGISRNIGNATLTNRSDGSSNYTKSFGNGSIVKEKDASGKTITGITRPFGSGNITKWNDGSTTQTTKLGANTKVVERSKNGKVVSGITKQYGSGSKTQWSNGTTNTNKGSFSSDRKR